MLWCLCLGRGKGKQRLSKYGVCQVLISSAAKVCLSELLSVPPQSPPLASAHKTSSSSRKYNGGNYNKIIQHSDKMQYSYLCGKQFSGIGRSFQQGGWEGGADTGQVGLKLLSMFKMFSMFSTFVWINCSGESDEKCVHRKEERSKAGVKEQNKFSQATAAAWGGKIKWRSKGRKE